MTPDAPVQWHDIIDSTNEEARRLAQTGTIAPLWIAARQQTAGRGRLGRNWVSPAGNLFCTALFIEPQGITVATRVPFAAGLAVVDTCRMIVPEACVRLKWPNDVRVERAKLCGILVEAGRTPSGETWVAAGLGLNVLAAPQGTGQKTTCMVELGATDGITAEFVFEALRRSLSERILQARQNFSAMLEDWEAFAEGRGEVVVAGDGENAVRGTFKGLASDGGLRIGLPDGKERIIRAGDVELVKEIGGDAASD